MHPQEGRGQNQAPIVRLPSIVRSTTVIAPAPEQHSRLQAAADLFNGELFAGALGPVYLTLQNKPGSWGAFMPNRYRSADGEVISSIALDSVTAVDRPLIELLSTLVHEQCHQAIFERGGRKTTGGHGPEWRAEMERCGLPPVQIGSTWRQATHTIDPHGLFARVYEEHRSSLQGLPWQEESRRAARGKGADRTKYQCPSCGQNAWARPGAELLCGTCSTTNPPRLVWLIGSSTPGATGTGPDGDIPTPSSIPGLPPWTDELGRECRKRTGLDCPPKNYEDALVVFNHTETGEHLEEFIRTRSMGALKQAYKIRARHLHPDSGGHEESFKFLQIAFVILKKAVT